MEFEGITDLPAPHNLKERLIKPRAVLASTANLVVTVLSAMRVVRCQWSVEVGRLRGQADSFQIVGRDTQQDILQIDHHDSRLIGGQVFGVEAALLNATVVELFELLPQDGVS